MTGIDESDITTCNPLHEQTCHHEIWFPVFDRNTELDCGSDASILSLDSVEIRAELMEMADEEKAGNRSEEMSPLSARDIKHSSLSTNPSITLLENTSVSLAHNIDEPFAHLVPAAISASSTVNVPSAPTAENYTLGLQILDTADESQPSNKTSYPKRFCPCCSRPEASLRSTLNQSAIALGVCVERSLSTILHRLDWTFLSVHICCVCYRKASAALNLARAIHSDVALFFLLRKAESNQRVILTGRLRRALP